MSDDPIYIHGMSSEEQDRLAALNDLTNSAYLNFVQFNANDAILEIGSGLGLIAFEIAEKMETGSVTGIEYAAEQIAQNPSHDKLTIVQGDAHQLPFDTDHFNVIHGRYVIEHLNDPQKAVNEAYRVLKPGGKIFLQENTISLMRLYPHCPNFTKVWNQFIELQGQLGGDAEVGIKLYSFLKKAGFQNIECTLAPEVHYQEKGTLNGWVDNLIGNIEGAGEALTKSKLADEAEIKNAISELTKFKKDEFASAYFYWNQASASK